MIANATSAGPVNATRRGGAGTPAVVPGGNCPAPSRRSHWRIASVILVLLAGLPRVALGRPVSPSVGAFLATFGLGEADIASLQAGRVVARILESPEDSHLSVAGVVHVRAGVERLAGDTAELWALMAVGDRLQAGSFSDPARLADLEPLAFDARDMKDVRACEPRDCSLKLDEAGMRIIKRVNWRAPGAHDRVGVLLKEWMLGTVVAYRRNGALPVYLDKSRPVSVAEAMSRSVSESPCLEAGSPFLRHVLSYPNDSLPGSQDSFYWSTEMLRKPVTSLHHLSLSRGPKGGPIRYRLADKHISDTHYFRSRLELLWLLEGEGPSDFYCVRMSLARVDPPRWLRHILMGRVRRATRKGLETTLDLVRRRLEAGGTTPMGVSPSRALIQSSDLHPDLEYALRWDPEEGRRASRVTGKEREQPLPPDRHARPPCPEQRLTAREIRRRVGVEVEAGAGLERARNVGVLHEPIADLDREDTRGHLTGLHTPGPAHVRGVLGQDGQEHAFLVQHVVALEVLSTRRRHPP